MSARTVRSLVVCTPHDVSRGHSAALLSMMLIRLDLASGSSPRSSAPAPPVWVVSCGTAITSPGDQLYHVGVVHDAERGDPALHISPLRPPVRQSFAFALAAETGGDSYELQRRLPCATGCCTPPLASCLASATQDPHSGSLACEPPLATCLHAALAIPPPT